MIWIATESALTSWDPTAETTPATQSLLLLDHLHQKFFLFPALRTWPFSALHKRYKETSTEGLLSTKATPSLWLGQRTLSLKNPKKMIQCFGGDVPVEIPPSLSPPDYVGCATLTLTQAMLSLLPEDFLARVHSGWTIASLNLPPLRPRLLLLHHGGVVFCQTLSADSPFEASIEGFHHYAQRRQPKEKFLYIQWHSEKNPLPKTTFWKESFSSSSPLTSSLLQKFHVPFQTHPWSEGHRQKQLFSRLTTGCYSLLTLLFLMVPGFFFAQHFLRQKCLFWEGQKPPRQQWEMTPHRLLEKDFALFLSKNNAPHRASTLFTIWHQLDALFMASPMKLSHLTLQTLPHGATELSLEGTLEKTSTQEICMLQKKIGEIFPKAGIHELTLPPCLDIKQDFEPPREDVNKPQLPAQTLPAHTLKLRIEIPHP